MKKRMLLVRRSEPSVRGSFARRNKHAVVIRYGECQRNHAASTGGHAVDGCREFMADGEEGTSGGMACAACGCHRNFHRRVHEYDYSARSERH